MFGLCAFLSSNPICHTQHTLYWWCFRFGVLSPSVSDLTNIQFVENLNANHTQQSQYLSKNNNCNNFKQYFDLEVFSLLQRHGIRSVYGFFSQNFFFDIVKHSPYLLAPKWQYPNRFLCSTSSPLCGCSWSYTHSFSACCIKTMQTTIIMTNNTV